VQAHFFDFKTARQSGARHFNPTRSIHQCTLIVLANQKKTNQSDYLQNNLIKVGSIMIREHRSSTWIAIFFAIMLGNLLASPKARAHLWYPRECCNELDCFRATSIVRQPDGSLLRRAGNIKVIVPPDFEKLPSQDREAHVCVFSDLQGRYHPRCVFLPGIS